MQTTRERWHGTTGGYSNHKCRCDDCRTAFREAHARYMARRRQATTPDEVHGTVKGYAGWSCRCQRCREAYGAYENKRNGKSTPYRPREVMRRERDERIAAKKAARKVAGYMGAHQIVRRTRGPAKTHLCEFCGVEAHDWALIATASQILSRVHPSRGYTETWSVDPFDYRPLCRKCHRSYDWHVREFGTCIEGGCSDPGHVRAEKVAKAARTRKDARKSIRGSVCPNGHDLTLPGARRTRSWDGRRECVQCNRDRSKKWRDSKKLSQMVA